MNRLVKWAAACVVGGMVMGTGTVLAKSVLAPGSPPATAPSTRPAPKAISENVKKGLVWLAKGQHQDGSWGQGEESSQMGGGGKLAATPNVADTCMAIMALYRGGSTPAKGDYAGNMLKGVQFVCAQIEDSDEKSLFCTSLRGTRTQSKLGTYIDTFLAAQMLGELKDQMPSDPEKKRVDAAIAKLVKKIETNQKEDGRWANEGWAPTLAQGQAAKTLNYLAASGVKVDEKARQAVEKRAQEEFKGAGGRATADSAGVEMYSRGAQVAAMNASTIVNADLKVQYQQALSSPATAPAEREKAVRELARIDKAEKDADQMRKEVVQRMEDPRFVAGFGNNGGEEFLSHLNIGEALFTKGGEEWTKWDEKMTANMNRIQNADGSWTGHHCITGRTFCTSAALMVLTVDRSPLPVNGKIKRQ